MKTSLLLAILLCSSLAVSQTTLDYSTVTVCAGGSATVTASNPQGVNVSFQWTANNQPTQQGNILSLSNLTQSVTWTCTTFDQSGIPVDNDVVVITVNPTPVLTPSAPITICDGATTIPSTFTNSEAGGTFAYALQNPPAGGTITGHPTNGNGQIPAATINNSGPNPYTLNYTITPIANNCNGTTGTYSITVIPSPVTTFALANQSICSGTFSAAVTLNSTTPGVTFAWQATVPAGVSNVNPTNGSGNISAFTNVVNATNMAQNIQITATASNAGGLPCPGPPATYTITVNPTPVLTLSANQTICSGQTTAVSAYTNSVAGGTFAYALQNAGSVPASVTGYPTNGNGQIPAATINNSGTNPYTLNYTITPIANYCNGTTGTYSITVNPSPVATSNFVSNNTVCSGQNINIALSSTTAGTTFTWTAANGAGVTGGQNSAAPSSTINQALSNSSSAVGSVTYTITPSVAFCNGTPLQVLAYVNPVATIAALTSPTVCPQATITPTAFVSTPNGASFAWTNTNTAIGIGASGTGQMAPWTAPANNTNAAITGTMTVTPTYNGCTGTPSNFTVTINPTPTVTNNTLSQAICSGTSTTAVTWTSNVAGTTYAWTGVASAGTVTGFTASGSSNLPVMQITNSSNAVQTVTYTVTPTYNGCAGTPINFTVTINPTPTVTNNTLSQAICSGTSTTAVTWTSNVAGTTYAWTGVASAGTVTGFTASGSSNLPVMTITNSGNTPQTVTYTVTPTRNGCSGPAVTYVITVNPTPNATITHNGPTTFCQGGSVVLSVINQNGQTYAWQNNSSPIAGGLSYAYQAFQTGLYGVIITNQYNCIDSNDINVNNLTMPTATIANSSPANFLCQGDSTVLTSAVNCQACNLSYAWSNGNTTPTISVSSSGTYYLVISNSLNNVTCSDTSNNIAITVLPLLVPTFTNIPDSICFNDTYTLPQLSNNFISGNWSPAVISNSTNTYIFTPLQGQCAYSDTFAVVLVNGPTLNIGNDTVVCQGDSLIFGAQGFASYLWNDGSTSSSLHVTPTFNSVYSLAVTNNFGCVGYDTVHVNVNQNPPVPVITGDTLVCGASLDQLYTATATPNWLIWSADGANIYSGQHTNQVHLNITSNDTLWVNLTEHVLQTGCFSTATYMVLIDTSIMAPASVPVMPLGLQNDFLYAPQASNVLRWGKLEMATGTIYYYPATTTYYNFTTIDTLVYQYFIDCGVTNCYTRSYYNPPAITTSLQDEVLGKVWVAPNPVADKLIFHTEHSGDFFIRIRNVEGQEVFNQIVWANSIINCEQLLSGIYFAEVTSESKSIYLKFLKL